MSQKSRLLASTMGIVIAYMVVRKSFVGKETLDFVSNLGAAVPGTILGIGYIIAIDRVVDMMRTMTNVTGQILVPVIVAKEERILDQAVYDGNVETHTPAGEAVLVAAE